MRIRKNLAGALVMLAVQMNGMGGALVVKTAFHAVRLLEDWI